jgi:hypothetical protein
MVRSWAEFVTGLLTVSIVKRYELFVPTNGLFTSALAVATQLWVPSVKVKVFEHIVINSDCW